MKKLLFLTLSLFTLFACIQNGWSGIYVFLISIGTMLVTEIILVIISFAFNLPSSILFAPLVIFPGIYTYVSVKQERNAQEIEKSAPPA